MTTADAPTGAALNTTWKTAPTQTINAGGVEFAYRQLGPSTGLGVSTQLSKSSVTPSRSASC
jgi:hypothetical protein